MPKTANLTIMFADISGSTRLFETLGDAKARTTVANVLTLLITEIERYRGAVIKTIGDEIMCTFNSADNAAQAARSMHEKVEENIIEGIVVPHAPIKIRIGFHFGPVLVEGDDIFGDAVNIAARMTAQSKSGQIITTSSTIEILNPMLTSNVRFVDRAYIRGKKNAIDIYEIIWQEEDMTRMSTDMMNMPRVAHVALRVEYKRKKIELNRDRLSVVMGRDQNCDLSIDEKFASRQHARIELRRDKFFVVDQSTNGTYISLDQAEDVFLRREEAVIYGGGRISLGRPFKKKESAIDVVHFFEYLQ